MNVLGSIDLTHIPITGRDGERPLSAEIFHDPSNPVVRLYCTDDGEGALFDTRKAMLLRRNHPFSRESLRQLAAFIQSSRSGEMAKYPSNALTEAAALAE